MQKFVDHTDYDHLVSTLYEDFKPLFNRLKRIENQLKSTKGTILNVVIKRNKEVWVSPKNKNKWTIRYSTLLVDGKYIYNFYPYIDFQSYKDEKVYFLLNSKVKSIGIGLGTISLQNKDILKRKGDFKEFLSENNISIIIMRSHFIDQYRGRTDERDISDFDTMIEFGFNPQILIVDNFIQNVIWRMCLHTKGVAMLKVQNNYIVFETFVPTHDLGEDQITAISNFLTNTHVAMYFLISVFMLRRSDVWVEFIDKNKLLDSFNIYFRKNPEQVKGILNNYEFVRKLILNQLEKHSDQNK